jgi:sulfotransferase family protein
MTIGELPHRPADRARTGPAAPVVVLGYPGSGIELLRPVLAAFPGLACTAGTGILPLCHHAVTAWRAVDQQAGRGLSPLAAASVRTLAGGLVAAILARDGGHRWCEFAMAPPSVAEAFAVLYQQARFLVVHRRADAVMRAVVGASPWGLAGAEYAPFVSASPASTAAALAAFWVARTVPLLEFEDGHPGSCLRVRAEDVRSGPARLAREIAAFLDMAGPPGELGLVHDPQRPEPGGGPPAASSAAIALPPLPAPLLAQVNELHGRLGYPAVTAADR